MVVKAIISDLDGVVRSFPYIEQRYSLPEASLFEPAFGFSAMN